MSKVSLHLRNKAMRILCDYDWGKYPSARVSEKYLYCHGFPKSEDAVSTLRVLNAMGYVELYSGISDQKLGARLTDKGRSYFETRSDEFRSFIKRSVIVPIIVAFATTVITTNVWPVLWNWLQSLLQR